MTRLLLTRPAGESAKLAAELHRIGYDVLVDPLLTIRWRDPGPMPLDGVQALLATSANGIRGFVRLAGRSDLPVLTVGDATAAAAREAGFADVRSAGGDAGALTALVAAARRPQDGPLLHAAGADRTPGFPETLEAAGFTVRTTVVYEAVPARRLAPESEDAIRTGTLGGVLLFSPRTAAIFVRLVTAAELAEYCAGVRAYCLSHAVADRAAGLPWQEVLVAVRPDTEGLLQALAKARDD